MKLKLKITKLLNSKDSIGDIFLEESKIGSFSFKSQSNGIYMHYLFIFEDFRGNKLCKEIVSEIKKQLSIKSIFFHAQDLDNPSIESKGLIDYYVSLGFFRIKDNLFKA